MGLPVENHQCQSHALSVDLHGTELFGSGEAWQKRSKAGQVGPEELPARVRKELDKNELDAFLSKYRL